MKDILISFFYMPGVKSNFWAQVNKNYLHFSNRFILNTLILTITPFLLYLSFGYGIGQLIDPIWSMTYIEFITPTFLILTGSFVSLYEAFHNYYKSSQITKGYLSILNSPMSDVEISFGEMIWASIKGTLSISFVLLFTILSKDISMHFNPLNLIYIFLNNFSYSILGVILAKFSSPRMRLDYIFLSLFMPVSIICGSFFPLFRLPLYLKQLSLFFPSTHYIFLVHKSYFDLYYSTYFASLGFCLMGTYILLSFCLNKKPEPNFE